MRRVATAGVRTESSFWYLASPYSKTTNLDLAWEQACKLSAILINLGYIIYSPIAHSHQIAKYVEASPRDSAFWVAQQRPFLLAAEGVIIATLLGWRQSEGIAIEREYFTGARKPIRYMDPVTYMLTESPSS